MSESIVLELQNGAFAWLAAFAAFIFLRYIWKNASFGYKYIQGAIALATVWIGQVVIRGSLWENRYHVNLGEPREIPNINIMIGAAICICGFLCVIRVFSEESWKPWAWKIALGGGVVFLTASYYKVLPI
jgi:hypothetical protein